MMLPCWAAAHAPGGTVPGMKEQGFTLDMGPSWYWMPEILNVCRALRQKVAGLLSAANRSDTALTGRMDQWMYRLNYGSLKTLWKNGARQWRTDWLLYGRGRIQIQCGHTKLVHETGRSVTEFLDWNVIKGVFRMDVFANIRKLVMKTFKNPQLRQMMEFLFCFWEHCQNISRFVQLMNYADIKLGAWYPVGMYKVVDAMYKLATELGVQFCFDHNVTAVNVMAKTLNR